MPGPARCATCSTSPHPECTASLPSARPTERSPWQTKANVGRSDLRPTRDQTCLRPPSLLPPPPPAAAAPSRAHSHAARPARRWAAGVRRVGCCRSPLIKRRVMHLRGSRAWRPGAWQRLSGRRQAIALALTAQQHANVHASVRKTLAPRA
eukprot:354837-Chlamydomonas_euryale.AAC.7